MVLDLFLKAHADDVQGPVVLIHGADVMLAQEEDDGDVVPGRVAARPCCAFD